MRQITRVILTRCVPTAMHIYIVTFSCCGSLVIIQSCMYFNCNYIANKNNIPKVTLKFELVSSFSAIFGSACCTCISAFKVYFII